MTSFRDDKFIPPNGWQPTDAERQRMRDAPAVDLDLHLGGSADEESGLRWLEDQRKAIREESERLGQEAEVQRKEARLDDAIRSLERATQLAPDNHDLLLALSQVYNEAHREREAAQVLEKVIASFGNRRTKELAAYHHQLARALARLGDHELALAQLDESFKIDPGSLEVLKDLGVLALETNDLDRAQKTFRALLLQRLEPGVGISKGEVFYYLGEISSRQGDKTKAKQMFERAVENDPKLEGAVAKRIQLKT